MASTPPFSVENDHVSEKIDITPVSNGDAIESTSINEKALMRKIDSRLLPGVTLLYLCSFLDRSNGGQTQFC